MSLTSFLKEKDVKDVFKQEFKKPQLKLQAELLAPPLTNHYSLVGTAFDYLLRFYIKRLNPDAIERPWVSEEAPFLLGEPLYIPEEGITISREPSNPTLRKKVKEIIQYAKDVYNRYLNTGKMDRDLFKAVLLLAQVDVIYRAGFVDENLGNVDENDIKDLQNLISIVRAEYFRANKICVLNPTFGKASQLVGGADCDLVIDDAIIDIKTTKKLDLRRNYLDQLTGYYALYKIGGIDGMPPDVEINRLGIYFSRYVYLHYIDVQNIIRKDTFSAFVEWFRKRAGEEYGSHI